MSTEPAAPAAVSDLIRRSERALNAGQRDEAARLLTAAQALAPHHPMVLNALGVQDLHQGKFSSALTYLEQAIT
jgi:Flp pilus assembly protein TadD